MSYTFDQLTRLGMDSTYNDQRTIQNTQHCNYLTTNYSIKPKESLEFAVSQPGINYNGYEPNIEESSKILIGTIQTTPKARIGLQQRPFLTVPCLIRGPCNAVMEAQLLQGETLTSRKSVTHLSEQDYSKFKRTPLLPKTQEWINKSSMVNDDIAFNGGLASREQSRDSHKK